MPDKKDKKIKSSAIPRLENKPIAAKAMVDPAAEAEKRDAAREKNKPLSRRMAEINSLVPAGTNRIGRMFKAAATGAAVGSSLGEALANHLEKKAQMGTPNAPRTISETALNEEAATDYSEKGGRPAGGQYDGYKPRTKRRTEPGWQAGGE